MRIFLIFLFHYFWSSPREAMVMLHLSNLQYILWHALGEVIYGSIAVVILLGVVFVVRYSLKKVEI
jgi:hypothetical protein